jgi:hypothetical protein
MPHLALVHVFRRPVQKFVAFMIHFDAWLAPHPTHARADVDSRALAWSAR